MDEAADNVFVALIRTGDYRPEFRILGHGDGSETDYCRVRHYRRCHGALLLWLRISEADA